MDRVSRVDMILSMLASEPDDLFLNYSLALEYVANTDYEKAETAFKKTIHLQNEYVPAFFQMGKLMELQNKNEEALKYYKKGLIFAQQQKNNKAINEIGEAIFMLED